MPIKCIIMFWLLSQDKIICVCLRMAQSFVKQTEGVDYKSTSKTTLIGLKVQTRGLIYQYFSCAGVASGAI